MTKFGSTENPNCSLGECHTCVGTTGLCSYWLKAQSMKYSSAQVWSFAEISPGTYALFNPARQVILMTKDWDEVLRAYLTRSPYVPPVRAAAGGGTVPKELDVSKLNITL